MKPSHLYVFIIALLASTSFRQSIRAQSPTLSAGLTTVTGQKGDLDIALLSEIVSEKQEEVKREILQRKILNVMEGKSFALQNYVYSNFYALLSFKDAKAIEKELLTQASILSLQVGMAEAVIKMNYRENSNGGALRKVVEEFIESTYEVDSSNASKIHEIFSKKISRHNFLMLFNFDQILNEIVDKNVKRKKEKPQFKSILLDMVFEASRTNKELEDKGFVKIHPNLALDYDSTNVYRQLKSRNQANEKMYGLIKAAMDLLVEYHPLFHQFINEDQLSIKDLHDLNKPPGDSLRLVVQNKTKNVASYLQDYQKGMNELNSRKGISEEMVTNISGQLEKVLAGLWDFNARHKSGMPDFKADEYYFIAEEIEPFFTKATTLGIFGQDKWKDINVVKSIIFSDVLDEVYDKIEKQPGMDTLAEMSIGEYAHLIKIITSLSQLDNVRSYEHIFNTLAQVGINNLENTDIKFLKDIIYYLEAYSTIDRQNNAMNVEVEALLLKILSLYENRASGDFQLYFGVGLGQTFKINYDQPKYSLLDADSNSLNNLGFATEKIGVKLKLINNKRIQSMQKEELTWFLPKLVHGSKRHRSQEPVISDLYVFGYGSGLLYNIADLTTAGNNFDDTMIGVGIGIAFFNALDLSIWRVSPMVGGEKFGKSWQRRQFWGFSFDVKLTEYLSAVGEKRRLSKATLN